MKLPNAENAQVPQSKITDYLLDVEHIDGQRKAAFFLHFGFSVSEWEQMADALRAHGQTYDVTQQIENLYGMKYIVEGELNTPDGRNPFIRSVWIVEKRQTVARLITAYPIARTDDD